MKQPLQKVGFSGGLVVKNLPTSAEDNWILGFDPWVGKMPWRRKCLEKSHGQRSLVGYSPWGGKESDMTEHASTGH